MNRVLSPRLVALLGEDNIIHTKKLTELLNYVRNTRKYIILNRTITQVFTLQILREKCWNFFYI